MYTPSRCVSGRSPKTQLRESRDTMGNGAACHHVLRQLACPSSLEPPFLLPWLLPACISSQDRFTLPPFAALPLGGQALLLAELDAGARRLPASESSCCQRRMRS